MSDTDSGSVNTVNGLKKEVSELVFARQIFSSGLQWYSGLAAHCLSLGIADENFIVPGGMCTHVKHLMSCLAPG